MCPQWPQVRLDFSKSTLSYHTSHIELPLVSVERPNSSVGDSRYCQCVLLSRRICVISHYLFSDENDLRVVLWWLGCHVMVKRDLEAFPELCWIIRDFT